MLKNELKIWDHLMDSLVSTNQAWEAGQTIEAYKVRLLHERKAIEEAWATVSFTDVSDIVLQRYFGHHLKEIRLWLDYLQGFLANHPLAERSAFINLLIAELQQLLKFLESYFAVYLARAVNSSDKTSTEELFSGEILRLALNLSVAELACLIKLFYDAGYFPASGVIDVIRFFAKHAQTKKRTHISAGNLSKEYYSISQKTAASCRVCSKK